MSNIDERWGSWSIEPPEIPAEEIKESYDCDVLILGAGISGVTCALRSAQLGMKVMVMEKFGKWNARGGNIGVSGSKFMESKGYKTDLDAVAREWIKRCANRCDEEIVWKYLKESPRAMDWLMDIVTMPEYGCKPDLQGCIYKGETYREVFGSHRFFDGPMAKKGMRPGASDAVYAMYNESLKLGSEYLFNCPAVRIIKENGRVTAAIGEKDGKYIRVNASRGVVIATGDIGGNDDMCADLAPMANRAAAKIYTPVGGNTGDGHRLGLWAGGAFEDTPFPLMMHPQAYFFLNICYLFVDQQGKRFMNEDNYIQGKGLAILRRGMKYAWSIIDGEWLEKTQKTFEYGGGLFWDIDHAPGQDGFTYEKVTSMLERGMNVGNVVKADTIEELAEKMGVPVENLVNSVNRINELAENGHDDDFGKRKELLFKLNKAPYYALKFGPAVLAVVGGLRVNTELQVKNENNEIIPGLYAIGNAAGGRYGVDYPMLIVGNSHGTALTFGFLAAENIAK